MDLYRSLLIGRRFVVSFQTVAEIRFGARRRGWGPERIARVVERLASAEVVWSGPELLNAYVDLPVACE